MSFFPMGRPLTPPPKSLWEKRREYESQEIKRLSRGVLGRPRPRSPTPNADDADEHQDEGSDAISDLSSLDSEMFADVFDAKLEMGIDFTSEHELSFEDIDKFLNFMMMFVAGETGEPSADTTTVIEQIVHDQVVEILTKATAMATRRGSRTITTNDLFFLIRHDKAKTSRLMTFLSWKDVRKTARDSDDKGADAADAADDALGGGDVAGGPTAPIGELTKRSKKKIKLPWDITSFYNEQLPEGDDDDDEEEQEANAATLERLHQADKRTKDMSRDQYVHYSDCRQASFTYKKAKRFREWAGFGVVTDSKPNDDIVDILGFLLYDIVQALTEEALKVKHEEDRPKERAGESDQSKKRKRQTGLFDPPEEGTIPVTTKHVREAFRRLQEKPIPGRSRVWLGSKGLQKTELRLI